MYQVTVPSKSVNRAEISGPARSAIFLFGSARPGIIILQNLYNGLNICFGWGGGGQKLMKILLNTDIICDLITIISVNLQSQTCWILKKYIMFRILGNLKIF